ncbi:hypothetical protein [Streptomyces phytohabitans]|uniref:hypothetical protein n=1 Tax=Streptomyces phytohabitans TaxID=1150371 RepID=UPI00345C06C9
MFETVRRWYAWLRVRSAPPVTAPAAVPAPVPAPREAAVAGSGTYAGSYACTCRAALPYHPQEWRPAPADTVVVDTLPLVRPYVLAHEQRERRERRERRGQRAVLTVRVPVPVPATMPVPAPAWAPPAGRAVAW